MFIERFILCLLSYFLTFYTHLKNILIHFLFTALVDCYIKEFFLPNIRILNEIELLLDIIIDESTALKRYNHDFGIY